MAKLEIKQLRKQFGDVEIIKGIDLTVQDKEFVVLVGPSGCGKTSTLRVIAGLEEATSGMLSIDGRQVTDVSAKDRDIAMVFQSYALYPHMNVYDNMALALKMRRMPKDEIDRRVREAAKSLGLEALLDRRPANLSGGQRQRVAVGRAIVRQPKLFLFDEPLSNLDAKLRGQMRAELKRLHRTLEATIIYVTHDQVEAMTLGDMVVVMKDGIIQQVGAPLEVYRRPANVFVAGFIGSPTMNFLHCRYRSEDGRGQLEGPGGFRIAIPADGQNRLGAYNGRDILLGIRPEDIALSNPEDAADVRFDAKVDVIEPLGAESLLTVRLGDTAFVSRIFTPSGLSANQHVSLSVNTQNLHFFDPITEEAIN